MRLAKHACKECIYVKQMTVNCWQCARVTLRLLRCNIAVLILTL